MGLAGAITAVVVCLLIGVCPVPAHGTVYGDEIDAALAADIVDPLTAMSTFDLFGPATVEYIDGGVWVSVEEDLGYRSGGCEEDIQTNNDE